MDFYSILLARKLKKESGGDVTIESLVVTENGNYSETGKAYSPVVVNVPFPENGYLLESESGQAINITDGAPLYLQECKAEIESVQEGSGDPSPTNIRPIIGQTEVVITDNGINQSTDHDYHAYAGKTYTIQLGDTIYGGELDVVTGELTVTHESVDLGSLNWMYDPTSWLGANFYAELNNIKYIGDYATTTYPILCEKYKVAARNLDSFVDDSITVDGSVGQPTHIQVKDSTYTDAIAFKTAVTGTKLVYELATPYTIQLTPQQIRLLEGINNLSCNTGELNIEYFGKGGN